MGFEKIRIRELRLSFALTAILSVSLGLFLILMPNTSRKLLCTLVGAGAALYGLTNIISHLPRKHEHTFAPALLADICALALGAFALIHPVFLMDFLFTVLALIVLITSSNGIRHALRLRSLGYMRWRALLFTSLTTSMLALSIIFFPGFYGNLLIMLCGALLAVNGTCELLSRRYLNRYLHP